MNLKHAALESALLTYVYYIICLFPPLFDWFNSFYYYV